MTRQGINFMAGFRKRNDSKGFTLAELLVTIAILGILASLALPRFFPQTERARASEASSILSAIRQGEESYFLEQGQYIASDDAAFNWQLLGIDNPNDSADYFSYAVSYVGGDNHTFQAAATRNAVSAGTGNEGKTIILDNTGAFSGTHTFVPKK